MLTNKSAYDVYDGQVSDERYMGGFNSIHEARKYVRDYRSLFSGEPMYQKVPVVVEETKGWHIYLITSGTRTYIGASTDINRRLRQHNGEIRGGARSTKGRKWELVMSVGGFENRSSAYRWEKLVKSRAKGIAGRKLAMFGLSSGLCPGFGKRVYEVPEGLTCTLHL